MKRRVSFERQQPRAPTVFFDSFCVSVLVVLDALLTLLDARDHILMNAPSLLFAYAEAKPRMLQKHQGIVDDGCVSHV